MENIRKSSRTTRGVPPRRYRDSTPAMDSAGNPTTTPVRRMSPVQSSTSDVRKQKIELEAKRRQLDMTAALSSQLVDLESDAAEYQETIQYEEKCLKELMDIPEVERSAEQEESLKRYQKSLERLRFKLATININIKRVNSKIDIAEKTVEMRKEVDNAEMDLDEQYLGSDEEEDNTQKPKPTPITKSKVHIGGNEMSRITMETPDDFSDHFYNYDSDDNDDGKDDVGGDDDSVGSSRSTADNAVDKLVAALEKFGKSQKKDRVVINSAIDRDLPMFSGKPEEWISFKAHYDRTSRKHHLDKSDNLFRLRKALTGHALEAVKYMFNCPSNVSKIMQTLEMEFGRPELIIESLIRVTESAPNPDVNKPDTIVIFARAVQSLVCSIQGHNQADYLNNVYLLNKLTDKLPVTLKRDWIQWYRGDTSRVKNLITFEKWISAQKELACEMVKPKADGWSTQKSTDLRPRRGPGLAAAAVNSENEAAQEIKQRCPLCKKSNHQLDRCWLFKKKTVTDKWAFVKNEKLCYSCLGKDHQLKDCKVNTECGKDGCQRRHNRLLHDIKHQRSAANEENVATDTENDPNVNSTQVYSDGAGVMANVKIIRGADGPLGVVPVKVKGPNGIRLTYALLDSGATSSFIDGDLASELGLPQEEERVYQVKGFFSKTTSKKMQLVSFEIKGDYPGAQFAKISRVNAPQGSLGFGPYSCNVDEMKRRWPYLRKMKMKNLKDAVIKVVIGEDNGALTLHRRYLYEDDASPVGKRTKLGWYVGGKIKDTDGVGAINYALGSDEYLHQLVKTSFSLENFGVQKLPGQEKGYSVEDKKSIDILKSTYKKENARCQVGLLWRNKDVVLPESKEEALDRLVKIERKLKREPEFGRMYQLKIQEYLEKGYITKISPSSPSCHPHLWYIPHFGVSNPNKPGKLRLVFDAAAVANGKCLNDYLMKGPDLIRPISEVLWNFRRHPVAVCGDIEDMFHRVDVQEEDRWAQHFLWRDGDSTRVPDEYVMNVLIFGATSSPASAIFVKNHNAEEYKEEYPEACRVITEDFFVDDALFGAKTEMEAVKLVKQVVWINQQANFNVRKWISNSPEVLSQLPPELCAQDARSFTDKTSAIPSERVLGLWWDPREDTFSFRANYHKVKPEILEGKRPTKREMCKLVMSLYDPIGFINNFKIRGLMILQMTWREKIGWDDEVGDDIYLHWKSWVSEIPNIEKLKITRCYHRKVDEAESVELHTLVDASLQGYCAISYLRVKLDGEVTLSFVSSKVRVAPLKKSTIPRLELMAALLGTRLSLSIEKGLRLKIAGRHYWSDSRTVLAWIKTETGRLKEFVANRVGEIQETTDSLEWHWVPTNLNVADDGTRLHNSTDFSDKSRWINGPSFLLGEPETWPKEKDTESLVIATVSSEGENTDSYGLPVMTKFSSYNRLLRATASVVAVFNWWKMTKKFGHVRKGKSPWSQSGGETSKLKSNLSLEDLGKAEILLMRCVQMTAYHEEIAILKNGGTLKKKSGLYRLSPILDDQGLIRLCGRIENAQVGMDSKQPIILPSNHHLTELLIIKEHISCLHQERDTVLNNLRQRFWITGGRNAVNKAIRRCPGCHLRRVKPVVPEMGGLPSYRLASFQPAFTFTGVDFFGPVEVTVQRHREKRWVSLFVCMVTRAIHLEVAHGLSTDDMMMVLSRFMDTRGRPSHIYSDNGTNFVGASRELKEALKQIEFDKLVQVEKFNGIQWHFNPPAAPHMGGAWERLVRTVKKALSATLKELHPRDQTFLTAIKSVENVVNSRPITYVSADSEDPEAITPNHFLRGGSDSGPAIPAVLDDSDKFLRRQWKVGQRLANHYWERWTKDYLPELIRRQKWHEKAEPIQIGDLVVIVDDQKPRNFWVRAVVTAVFPGKDGQVRVVEVSTRDFKSKKVSTYRRPVSKICPIGLKLDAGTLPHHRGPECNDSNVQIEEKSVTSDESPLPSEHGNNS